MKRFAAAVVTLFAGALGAALAPPAETSATKLAAIDRLLEESRYTEAAAACDQIAGDSADIELPGFLMRYGRALRGAGRIEQAIETYLRVTVHFPETPESLPCLVEAATLVRDRSRRTDEARVMFQAALVQARARGDARLADQIAGELGRVPERAP